MGVNSQDAAGYTANTGIVDLRNTIKSSKINNK